MFKGRDRVLKLEETLIMVVLMARLLIINLIIKLISNVHKDHRMRDKTLIKVRNIADKYKINNCHLCMDRNLLALLIDNTNRAITIFKGIFLQQVDFKMLLQLQL